MKERNNIRKMLLISFAVFFMLSAFFAARGTQVSNLLKGVILTELSSATGREVLADRIYINLFPLFIEASEIRVSEKGNEIFYSPRIKGYINISGLFNRELVLRRLALKDPRFTADADQLDDIVGKIREYIRADSKTKIRVVLKSVVVENGSFGLSGRGINLKGSGLSGELVLDSPAALVSKNPMLRTNLELKDIVFSKDGMPDLRATISAAVIFKDGIVEMKRFHTGFYGSSAGGTGRYSGGEGGLELNAGLMMKSFKDAFGLKGRGDGEVTVKGTVRFENDEITKPVLELSLKGDMYIQTLLELLRVDEDVSGAVSFSGRLTGPVARLKGYAEARMRKGNLFSVAVDELICKVEYREGMLYFKDGKAFLYNGRAAADAEVRITGESYFSLDLKASDVDSRALFGLIGWDPGIPDGRVKGELSTSGKNFDPSGWFDYESIEGGSDVLGRVRKAKGFFTKKGDVISFYDSEARTEKSSLDFSGDIDIAGSVLALNVLLKTGDLRDITGPYFTDAKGSGDFRGTVTGSFGGPLIRGRARLNNSYFKDYGFGLVNADIVYRREMAEIINLNTENIAASASLKGAVRFREARELFDLKKPEYDLNASFRNADLEHFLYMVYKKDFKPRLQGRLNADFSIKGAGTRPLYEGSARVENAVIGDALIDSVTMRLSYNYEDLIFRNAVFRKNMSVINAEGRLAEDGSFRFSSEGIKIHTGDVMAAFKNDFIKKLPADIYIDIKTEGSGSLDKPRLNGQGILYGGKYKGIELGKGDFRISLDKKTLVFSSALFDGRVRLSGDASLEDRIPWKARLELSQGRYDFLVQALMKDLPEDLLLQAKGYADMSGDRDHMSMNAGLSMLNITLYGHSFSNDADIRIDMKDRKIRFSSFSMKSGSTSLNIGGSIDIAKGYDLTFEGSSVLTPLKGFSKRIASVRGDSRFVFALTGDWDNPKINGGLDIANGHLSLKDIPYSLSSMKGSVYFDEEKVVVQGISARTGGGDIDISGIAYLQRFRLKRFFIDAIIRDISMPVSRDFDLNFSGNLLLKGTQASQTLSGDIKLNRANYRQRIEWKSWLLTARTASKPRAERGDFDSAQLNIRVHGSDNITVDNNVARASLSMDLLLRGTIGAPLLSGRVETRTGTLYFRNNEFRILNATADFTDPRKINPQIGINAETSIRGYTIKLNLDGRIEHFNLSLSSDPPLPDSDILALLTVGMLGKEMKGIEGGISAGEATSFLTGKMQDVLEERVRSLTGLDRLEVDPYVSKTTKTVSPRVNVSKRLLGDKLFVTYSSSVGSSENNLLKLEYVFNRNISLIGVRDEKGGIGSDIKFRFEFR